MVILTLGRGRILLSYYFLKFFFFFSFFCPICNDESPTPVVTYLLNITFYFNAIVEQMKGQNQSGLKIKS